MGTKEGGQQCVWGLRGDVAGVALSFVLRAGQNLVGASQENSLVLAFPGVSRRHAVITCKKTHVSVADLGSKNGTFVNGVRITTATLQSGDEVAFGPVCLKLVPLAPGDTQVLPTAAQPKPHAARQAGERASTSACEEIPVSWLFALEPWFAGSRPLNHQQVNAALVNLGHTLQAGGVVLAEWHDRAPVAVLNCAGTLPEPALLDQVRDFVTSALPEPSSARPVASAALDTTKPPVLVAWCPFAERKRAVLVMGDFPGRRVARPFLELVCQAMNESPPLPALPTGPLTLLRRGNLVFPPGYVPGSSPAMKSVYHQLSHLVSGDIPVLIAGETGVGKEPIAHILHLSSPRRSGPFVAVNCAAIPTELLEVELFGIEAGVATGVAKREGKFQLAHGGVIVLDEISDMSPALQAKLLRVLQEREVNPVGARRPIPVDVRVIAMTNADLLELVAQGRFRQDLYFRVAGFTLSVPPLRARREDIPNLVLHFLERFSQEVGKHVSGISTGALEALVAADWPGNVRQLENEVRRLVYLCLPNQPITVEMLSGNLNPQPESMVASDGFADLNLQRQTAKLERTLIAAALQRTGGRVAKAAQLLGLSRQGLRLKLQRLGGDMLERTGEDTGFSPTDRKKRT